MKIQRLTLSIIIGVLLFSVSCKIENTGLNASSGKTGEVLFIVDRLHWEDIVGDSIRAIFGAEYLGVNQPEPMFNLAHIEKRAFSKMFESHRNIFIVDIEPGNETKSEIRKNVWAQPQVVVKIKAPTIDDFLKTLSRDKRRIKTLYLENERERMMLAFKRDEDPNIGRQIKENFGFGMVIPNGYFIATMEDDFCWVRRETEETSIGLLIYTTTYSDTADFHIDSIIKRRNFFTQKFVHGSLDGSYMKVSQAVVQPFANVIDFKGLYAVETRGLWDMHGVFMGGPFINYTFVDEATQKLTTLDGFIFAPRYDKRDYVFQTEALIYSISFAGNNENPL